MPVKGGRVTPKEHKFVKAMAETGNKGIAARIAGYSSPDTTGQQVAARPAIQAEIAREQTRLLFEQCLPLAVQTLAAIMSDSKAPAGARVQATKVVLDRTLGANDALQGKEPHEMTPEELSKAIDELERMAMARAKPIKPDPVPDIFE